MKIPVSFGGGGSGSDDCTAKASQVLSPYTAITSESDDEPIYGTMKDYAGTTQSGTSSLDTSNSRLRLAVPNEGRYTTASYIYQTYSNVASLISLTAAKIATGNTILGISGTYTGLGSATQAQVLSGKTFSTASLSNASGTMTDKSGTTTSATASLDTSNSRLRMAIPTTGYYNTSAYLYQTYSNIASLIGLTAAKIKYGETILGITGTWQGWVATSGDIYYNGSWGVLGSSRLVWNSGNMSFDSSCVTINPDKTYCATSGFMLQTALNCAGYSKITLTYQVNTAGTNTSSNNDRIWLGLYSSTSAISWGSEYVGTRSGMLSSTGTFTLSVDLSSVSSTLYVGVGFTTNASSSYAYWSGAVTRIALS